jgi:hypothetical protein
VEFKEIPGALIQVHAQAPPRRCVPCGIRWQVGGGHKTGTRGASPALWALVAAAWVGGCEYPCVLGLLCVVER